MDPHILAEPVLSATSAADCHDGPSRAGWSSAPPSRRPLKVCPLIRANWRLPSSRFSTCAESAHAKTRCMTPAGRSWLAWYEEDLSLRLMVCHPFVSAGLLSSRSAVSLAASRAELKALQLAVIALIAISAASAQAFTKFTNPSDGNTTIVSTPDGTGKTAHHVFVTLRGRSHAVPSISTAQPVPWKQRRKQSRSKQQTARFVE